MSLSCVPCARRKVRCDRMQPCSHCRRRKRDVCEYPVAIPVPNATPRSSSRGVSIVDETQSERMGKLEQYIRSLGHDPDRIVAESVNIDPATSSNRLAPFTVPTEDISIPRLDTARRRCTAIPGSRNSEQARLVEHDEQTTYIEAPLWYSWSEAERSGTDSLEQSLGRDRLGFFNTLIDPEGDEDAAILYARHPTAKEILELWNHFISHVHPMSKLFFDWAKEPVLQKAAENPQALSKAEQAFSFAIYFITILSLSDEECGNIINNSRRPQLLDDLQSCVETALLTARFAATSDLLVLQAFILYMLAMRNRGRLATLFSMMGIAVRTAQRLGLHRDGSLLGLSPVDAEEKRRVWWQLQQMDITISQHLGCLSMTLFADWDTKLPANLEDSDIRPGLKTLPSDRPGLTSMSYCLWRAHILQQQRVGPHLNGRQKEFAWLMSSHVPMAEKNAFVEQMARTLNEKFVQYCELLNPLHVSIQIGIRLFTLALKRIIRQPGVANTKISEIPKGEREEFLKISIEILEYYVLGETTTSIARFRWFHESNFQWPAFVYVIIEAHHRAAAQETSSLWTIINKVCSVHPKLKVAPVRPDIVAIGRLIVLAWHQRQVHLQKQQQRQQQQPIEKPWCVTLMEEGISSFVHIPKVPDMQIDLGLGRDMDRFMELDFDMIDWSAWEKEGYMHVLN